MGPIPDAIAVVSVPLGLWKAVEIVWWLATRVSINIH